jgi:hypothetical protein
VTGQPVIDNPFAGPGWTRRTAAPLPAGRSRPGTTARRCTSTCDQVARDRGVAIPPEETLGVLVANRIVYTEHWLRRDGYAPRQFWRRTADPTEAAQDPSGR